MPPDYSLQYFDPPRSMQNHVLAFFHFTSGATKIFDKQPGALGQLVIFPSGSGSAEFPSGRTTFSTGAYLLSSFSSAVPFEVDGPWHTFGASLSPLGWAALTKAPANEHIDRFFPAEELLGDGVVELANDLSARYRAGRLDGEGACKELCEWIRPRLGKVRPAHEFVIEQTLEWLGSSLNPDLADLYSRLSYSRRQVERVVERYFAVPPAALARKYRAIRASALLAQPEVSDRMNAIIAGAFHDRPHMIKEIRRSCGHTPTRLGGEADPILHTLIQMKNFERLQLFKGME